MTFSQQILIGLVGGILTGLFFGERASATAWVADGFVKLLQMMVLPYITVSIIASLGSLKPSELRTLGVRAAAVIGGLWLVALTFAFLIPLTFPRSKARRSSARACVERRARSSISSISTCRRTRFTRWRTTSCPRWCCSRSCWASRWSASNIASACSTCCTSRAQAISRATRFVTRLTPYGLFAIAANAAGTLDLQQLGRLQIYLVAYVAVALLVSLWVLPGLVAALTPIRARDMLRESQDSLLTASIAGDLFIVLPGLTQASRTLLDRLDPGSDEPGRLTDVIVPASFNFPHTGKLLSLSFVLFAGWFADAAGAGHGVSATGARGPGQLLRQPHRGGAVPARSVPHSRGYVPAVSRHRRDQLARRIAGGGRPHAHRGAAGDLRRSPGACAGGAARVLSYAGVTVALVVAVIGGTRLLFATTLSPPYSKDAVLASMQLLSEPVEATLATTPSPAPPTTLPPLETIAARGVLRVGYLPDALPFAFVNQAGDLVGFDVELAHDLARDLGVTLAFVPVDRDSMAAQLADGYCDLVMSGVAVTTERARDLLLSDSYLDETVAFVVPDHQRERFAQLGADSRSAAR